MSYINRIYNNNNIDVIDDDDVDINKRSNAWNGYLNIAQLDSMVCVIVSIFVADLPEERAAFAAENRVCGVE